MATYSTNLRYSREVSPLGQALRIRLAYWYSRLRETAPLFCSHDALMKPSSTERTLSKHKNASDPRKNERVKVRQRGLGHTCQSAAAFLNGQHHLEMDRYLKDGLSPVTGRDLSPWAQSWLQS